MIGNVDMTMEEAGETTTKKALASLAKKKPDSTISIAADLANDNLNSICRLALAWITDGKVHGLSFLIKPPTNEFTARKVTPEMIADRPDFATVWDREIKNLLKNDVVSAYHSETLFAAIKASYEASGNRFYMDDIYIRDLRFLSITYIPDLGNDSFLSIMHFMHIPVDLDSALSRAMGCVCGIDWLEKVYPVSSYGVPLSAVLAGALRTQSQAIDLEAQEEAAEAERKKYAPLVHYSKVLFLPFLILCVFLMMYFMHRYSEVHQYDADFSAYKAAEALTSATVAEAVLKPSPDGTYMMQEGTYVVLDYAALGPFIEAMKKDNIGTLQHLLRNSELIIFSQPTLVVVTGNSQPGFVTVKILEGVYSGKTGITPIVMINK